MVDDSNLLSAAVPLDLALLDQSRTADWHRVQAGY